MKSIVKGNEFIVICLILATFFITLTVVNFANAKPQDATNCTIIHWEDGTTSCVKDTSRIIKNTH